MQIWADLEGHLIPQWKIYIFFFYFFLNKLTTKKKLRFKCHAKKVQKWNYFEVKT
jgi:hypothetical protein